MQKEYIELENVCSSIIRGYTYVRQEVEMSNTAESGTHPVEVISFGDIDDNGTFTTNENTEKYILKNKNAFYKCRAEINDILLPSTAKVMAKAKLLRRNEGDKDRIQIYKSNIIIIKVEQDKYSPQALQIILNNKEMQKRLIDEVYSDGRVKSLSLDKLRQFKVPVPTKEFLKELNKTIEAEETIIKAKQKMDNILHDILS